jgi:spoIIIJ-associated protein
MGILAEIKIKENDDIVNINLIGPNMGLIIGHRGETLDSLQYLVSLVINKNNDGKYKKVILDTENYRLKREETLKRLATKIAYKVRKTNRAVKLEPMNPYERRIIHAALQNDSYVVTYSEGEEPYRKVVVDLKKKA